MTPAMKDKIERGRKALYLAVKANRPDLYQMAIRVGEMAIFHHGVSIECAAEIELGAMNLAAVASGIDTHAPH